MWNQDAIQRWVGVNDAVRALRGIGKSGATRRAAVAALALLMGFFAAPAAAQTTTVSITGANRPSFSRAGQPLTFYVELSTGNAAIKDLTFTSGSPTGMSALSCPGVPANLGVTTTCTFTYTTTDMDVAMGKVTALGRWRATREGAAARSGSTNTFVLGYAPPRQPDAPGVVTATASDGKATVTFPEPFDGGYPVDNYTVTSQPDGITASGARGPITVNGLRNGVTYRFTITATSTMGTSTSSPTSNAVTPQAPQSIAFDNPGAQNFGTTPTLSATTTSGLGAIFSSGTSAVCTITAGGALTFVSAGACTIHADQPGNAEFEAAPRVSRTFAVNAVVPDAPTIGTATAGDGEATVGFTAPASTGGVAIDGYTVTSTPGGFTGTGIASPIRVAGLANGTTYTFTVVATNSAGDGAASAASNAVTPSSAPIVTGVSVPAPNLYGPGETLDFSVAWDQPVTVAGTPRIALTIGSTAVQAEYVAGSGTASTTFRYTVLPGHMDFDGITVGTLSLNGGSLRNAHGRDATTTLNAVGSTAQVLVGANNQGPVNQVPGPRTVVEGDTLDFGSTLSISDADAGNAQIEVAIASNNGVFSLSTTAGLVFVTGDGTSDNSARFRGTLASINAALNGLIFVPTAVGSAFLQIVSDDRGNTGFGGAKTDTDFVTITVVPRDSTAPVVSAIERRDASPTNATAMAFDVVFSEPVTGVGAGDFTLVTTGTASASVTGLATSDNIRYTVTVSGASGDGTLQLVLNASGTGIVDTAGNAAPGYNGGPAYTLDHTAPAITRVTVPTAGQYIAGQLLTFVVEFSEPVQVAGTAQLPIALEVGARAAEYVSGSGTNALAFAYTVATGDRDAGGIDLGASIANGGAIADAAGNAATLLLNNVGDASGVIVGQQTQAITGFIATPATPVFVAGGTFAVSATPGVSSQPVVFGSTTPQVCTVADDTVTMIAAGTCSLTADQAADAHYDAAPQLVIDVTIAAATQVISGFIANPAAPVYAPNGTFALSATGGASGNPIVFASTSPAVCTVAGSVATMLAAGTCTLTADQAGTNDYAAAKQAALEVVIARAAPTLSWVGEMSRIVGDAAFDLPDPHSDSQGAFVFTSTNAAVATVSGRRVTLVGPGVTTLVATQAAHGNYAQGSVSATLTVTARPDPTKDASVVGSLQAQADASVRFAAAQLSNIDSRLRQQRFASVNRSSNDLTFAMASRSGGGLSMSADQFTSKETAHLPKGLAVWSAGAITSGGRDEGDQGGQFDFQSDGVTVGADWRFNDRVLLGVAGGWGWNDTDLDDGRSSLDAQQRAVSLYGLWRPAQRWFVDGIVGWGDLDFDMRRHSEAANATASASRGGEQAFGALTAGYEHGGGIGMTLTGYGRLDASRTTLDAYREQGLGLYDLAYGSQRIENSGASLGVEGSFPILTPRGTAFRPYWMLEYRETLENRSDVELNYVVLPVDGGYVLGMRGYGDNALTYGGGFDMELGSGWKLSVLGRRQHADGLRPSSTLGLTISFSPAASGPSVTSLDDGDVTAKDGDSAQP
ncbi:autotransporter domain-containing protein [Lysobacter arvi]|uniref:Autotransporter domain-containing protein n=1 Tax=Lysobacter arvi TaxID=3038776 RepID=A0ABU1CGZ0_9GAMM|nr:autotransporter domain-containing protein [Lysobacter arvi]MDR0184221.1 autotransporter domain-containing protein [Lysobacter arvi]